jgi:hypothetical protein
VLQTAGKAAQPDTNGAVAGRPSPYLPPNWPTRIGFPEALDGCRPENAAELVARQLLGEAPMGGGLFRGRWKYKENVGVVGFAPVLEVADVVRRLSPKSIHGLGSPIPLEEEHDLAARDQVTAPPVWRGGMPPPGVLSE